MLGVDLAARVTRVEAATVMARACSARNHPTAHAAECRPARQTRRTSADSSPVHAAQSRGDAARGESGCRSERRTTQTVMLLVVVGRRPLEQALALVLAAVLHFAKSRPTIRTLSCRLQQLPHE